MIGCSGTGAAPKLAEIAAATVLAGEISFSAALAGGGVEPTRLRPQSTRGRRAVKRPFRGLRREEPKGSYDAVVIGSGVGGLVNANLLQKAGLSVLLVEQHYMTGGYCSTFRRGVEGDAAPPEGRAVAAGHVVLLHQQHRQPGLLQQVGVHQPADAGADDHGVVGALRLFPPEAAEGALHGASTSGRLRP